MTQIRIATVADAGAILEIYKPYVLETAFSFETEIPSLDEFEERIKKYLQKYPWLVAEINGKLAGYAYGSVHRERKAYQWTCECSIYLHDDLKGKRIGGELYAVLFQILKMQGFRNVYAAITKPNEASERLHEKAGFEQFAVFDNIGCKFGRWYSVGWWQLHLNEHDPDPEPPVYFNKMSRPVYEHLLHEAAQKIAAKLRISYTG